MIKNLLLTFISFIVFSCNKINPLSSNQPPYERIIEFLKYRNSSLSDGTIVINKIDIKDGKKKNLNMIQVKALKKNLITLVQKYQSNLKRLKIIILALAH